MSNVLPQIEYFENPYGDQYVSNNRMPASSQANLLMQARVNLAAQTVSTTTSNTFTVPNAIGDTVIIPTVATAVMPGQYLLVGSTCGTYVCTAKVGSTATFRTIRRGAYLTASVQQAGQYVIDTSLRQLTNITTTTGTWAIPEVFNGSSGSVTLADITKVTVGQSYRISLYAGLYKLTGNLPGGAFEAQLAAFGDLPPGTVVPTGREVSSGYLLGIARPSQINLNYIPTWPDVAWAYAQEGSEFMPFDDIYIVTLSQVSATATNVTLKVGWSAAQQDELVSGAAFGNATAITVGKYRKLPLRAQDGRRLAVPTGSPILLKPVPTYGTTANWTAHVALRGVFG